MLYYYHHPVSEIISPAQIELQPKYCPICREANKPNADFCFSCNWILSKKGYLENKEKEAEVQKGYAALDEKIEKIQRSIGAEERWIE
ncbi:MAG: hypothetical protein M3299_07335, partial [Thermoproteota archaeon]|nr:hypothetical protein [Thermoproteota archaeon]